MGRRTPLAIVMLACVLVAFAKAELHAQTQRQQLIAAVRQSCSSAKSQLEEAQLPNLQRRRAALQAFFTNWKEKMPLHMRENIPPELQSGLYTETETLKALFASADALEHLTAACTTFSDGTDFSDDR